MTASVGPSCVMLVDKPIGPTSFDVVRMARKGLRAKVGHAGTLDPFACGLLLVLVGQATRASILFMGQPKEYEMTVQFGAVSSTADPTGEIVPTGGRVSAEWLEQALERFRGSITQRVPMTSAVKVGGEPLYRKAHRGEMVETPERRVMIHDLRMIGFDAGEQAARLVATTGSGTYMRTLAEDLGRVTGAGAYASALRRTKSGPFSVDDAMDMSELSPVCCAAGGRGVLSLESALSFMPVHEVTGGEAVLAENGGLLTCAASGLLCVRGPRGLIGVFEGLGEVARPVVVFPRTG